MALGHSVLVRTSTSVEVLKPTATSRDVATGCPFDVPRRLMIIVMYQRCTSPNIFSIRNHRVLKGNKDTRKMSASLYPARLYARHYSHLWTWQIINFQLSRFHARSPRVLPPELRKYRWDALCCCQGADFGLRKWCFIVTATAREYRR